MNNIALQLYSIKDTAEKDLLGTLEKVAEMGYQGAQFAGFFDCAAEEVRGKIDEVGIKPAGAHVPIDQLKNQLDETLKYHERIGNDLIICPFLPEDMRSTADDYKKIAELFNETGRKIKESGFEFGYHNHAFEFEKFGGKTGFDLLYENTDSAYVKMELDCFWASHAGYDPIEIIKKYAERCVSLHIKDMKVERDIKVSTEIGIGSLDIEALILAGKGYQINWFVVEQEDFSKDPLQSAEENAKALQEIVNKM